MEQSQHWRIKMKKYLDELMKNEEQSSDLILQYKNYIFDLVSGQPSRGQLYVMRANLQMIGSVMRRKTLNLEYIMHFVEEDGLKDYHRIVNQIFQFAQHLGFDLIVMDAQYNDDDKLPEICLNYVKKEIQDFVGNEDDYLVSIREGITIH